MSRSHGGWYGASSSGPTLGFDSPVRCSRNTTARWISGRGSSFASIGADSWRTWTGESPKRSRSWCRRAEDGRGAASRIERRHEWDARSRGRARKTGRLKIRRPVRQPGRVLPLPRHDLADVLRGRPLLALHEVELDGLPLSERLEPAALNGAVVDEAVLVSAI